MLVFVLNQAQKANTGKIQTPVYENVREFGFLQKVASGYFFLPVGKATAPWIQKSKGLFPLSTCAISPCPSGF